MATQVKQPGVKFYTPLDRAFGQRSGTQREAIGNGYFCIAIYMYNLRGPM